MLIKKQLDFANDVVTTTRGLFNNTSLKPDSLQYGLNDAVMAELKMDSPYYAIIISRPKQYEITFS